MKKITLILSFIMIALILNAQKQKAATTLTGAYFGQKAPDNKAEIFMDGIISQENRAEMNSCFSKDGKIFYFCLQKEGKWAIHITRERGGKWSQPKALPFTSSKFTDRDFTLSTDDKILYFGSNRPLKETESIRSGLALFYSNFKSGIWSPPKPLEFKENYLYGGNYPSAAANGNLYFFRGKNTCFGKCDLMVSKYINGKYIKPICLDKEINSKWHDWDSYIAPDESYIIFSSLDRPANIGEQDLYISFRQKNKKWTKAENMGKTVNSFSSEICPVVTSDGKYLLFTSRRRGKADIFWISADFIDKLQI